MDLLLIKRYTCALRSRSSMINDDMVKVVYNKKNEFKEKKTIINSNSSLKVVILTLSVSCYRYVMAPWTANEMISQKVNPNKEYK